MVGGKVGVSRRSNGPALLNINNAVQQLSKMDVLVGVPKGTTDRPGEPINNASLLYLHSHGSPLQGIPARPVIEPALNASGNKESLTRRMGIISKAVLHGNLTAAYDGLDALGIRARNIVYSWFVDPRNGWEPNAPATVAAKISKMSPKQIKIAMKRGGPLTRPLIDTGEMRKSITYIVREMK